MRHSLKSYQLLVILCILCRITTAQELGSFHSHDTARISRDIAEGMTLKFSDPAGASRIFRTAVMESSAAGFRQGIMLGLVNLGESQMNLGEFEASISSLLKSLEYCNNCSMRELIRIYNALAAVYIYKSEYHRAAYYYYRYLQIAETRKSQDPPLAQIYINLSTVWHLMKNDSSRQLHYINLAEQAAMRENDRITLGISLFRKGNFLLQRDHEAAMVYYEKALSIGREENDLHTTIASLLNIANVEIRRGNREIARRYYSRVDSLNNLPVNHPFHRMSFANSLGKAYYMLGDYGRAEQQIQRTLQLAEQYGTKTYQINPYLTLASVYAAQQRFREAYEAQGKYMRLNDSISSNEVIREANDYEKKYLNARQDHELVVKQLEVSNQRNHILQLNLFIGLIISGMVLLSGAAFFVYRGMKAQSRIQAATIQSLQRKKKLEQIRAIMQGEEQESIRIGMELHDGIGSILSVIKMNLSLIPNTYGMLNNSPEYKKIIELLDKTSTDLRETAHGLMLDSLLRGGLDESLQLFCEKTGARHGINIQYLSYGEGHNLAPDLERSVYRLLRDLVHMAVCRKGTGLVVLQLNWQQDLLSIIVEDDGLHAPGLNLELLMIRIQALGGTADIDYGQHGGTTVEIEIRLQQMASGLEEHDPTQSVYP